MVVIDIDRVTFSRDMMGMCIGKRDSRDIDGSRYHR